jgi:hypothetical protein
VGSAEGEGEGASAAGFGEEEEGEGVRRRVETGRRRPSSLDKGFEGAEGGERGVVEVDTALEVEDEVAGRARAA